MESFNQMSNGVMAVAALAGHRILTGLECVVPNAI
jgi:hypothetical protein